MSLPSDFALDTETDDFDGSVRTCLIQICSVTAGSINEVRLYEGLDCFEQFFHTFENTMSNVDCHVCNLDYEWSRMQNYVLANYTFVENRHGKMSGGQFTVVADERTVYKVKLCNGYGKTLVITDDLKRLGNTSVKKAGEGVKVTHPEWFEGLEKVKEDVEYNNGWHDPSHPDHDRFIYYSRLDAYTQAMIMRWVNEQGLDKNMTSASNGFHTALLGKYAGKSLASSNGRDRKYAHIDFKRYYPPLKREMQDMVENSLLGGFVYGETGTWKGTFVHLDYSSSYPYEYAFGNLGRGNIAVLHKGEKMYDTMRTSPNMIRWFVVSFDFEYLNGPGMPCISGRECRTLDNPMTGQLNKKMRRGHIEQRLFTETYLEELMKSYKVTNLVEHEMWAQRKAVGDFKKFIEDMYHGKSVAPAGSLERALYKLNMNGGIHGKTITKTHRKERVYYDGVKGIIDVVNEPEFQSTIGFTAMQNARERLLRDCRLVQEAGYKVLMCDTDSMIVNTTEENVRAVLGDKISKKTKTMEDLGKFEFEEDKEGNTEFDTFKCWGLKRYCEVNKGVKRKSAFAGMTSIVQDKLMDFDTDGTTYTWEQLGAKTDEFGKNIMMVPKSMKAENIWYEDVQGLNQAKVKPLGKNDKLRRYCNGLKE